MLCPPIGQYSISFHMAEVVSGIGEEDNNERKWEALRTI
jgi:hypothetical protein